MINKATIEEILSGQQSEESQESEDLTRRSFLWLGAGAIGAVYVGAIGYPVYKYPATPAQRSAEAAAVTETTLDGADALPVNSALMFKFGTKPAAHSSRSREFWRDGSRLHSSGLYGQVRAGK